MASEAREIRSAHLTPRQATNPTQTPPILSPSQYHSPSLSCSPLLSVNPEADGGGCGAHPIRPASSSPTLTNARSNMSTPRGGASRPRTPMFIMPLASPLRKAIQMTKLDPHDAWLPITESRNGNAYYAAFHTLCSGIGVQALVLPVAFTILGWAWGLICLTIAFIWQLYTLYLLVQLHESTQTGLRYSRYLSLGTAAFGEKLAKSVGTFPIMYLSMGSCVALIVIGGSTMRIFFQVVCGATCTAKPLTTVEWYLVFTCAAVVLSQLPNLNSIAGVSLLGSVTAVGTPPLAVGYCSFIWVVSVVKGRLPGVSYNPVHASSDISRVFAVLNALGIISFAFRGHNLILEIQATMPSSENHPSRVPMWKGVQFAYLLIAMCLFPLAIGGYWAYGQMIPQDGGGMLTALYTYHSKDTSRVVLGLTSLFVIINAISSFQIYGMPTFDDIKSKYTMRKKKPCPRWLRAVFRALFGFFCFFTAVAIPFLASFTGLVGGISLPVTLAYPCFMWIRIRKPRVYGPMWCLNWALGVFGMCLSVLLIAAGLYSVIHNGVEFKFFHPH